ncbi:MAG: hypothetical protein MJ241_00830 [Bacilli bacterium]|nr:hypothetical protein [Bacilli bacterium]
MAIFKKEKKTANGFRLLFGYLGLFIAVEGFLTLLPLTILAFYPAEWGCWMDFVIPAAGGIAIGLLMFFTLIAGCKKGKFGKRDDSLLLFLLWISAIILGAMPFFIDSLVGKSGQSGRLSMDFWESFFESMSGYSATGLTVYDGFLTDIPSAQYQFAHVFLFHRALMQFIGGVGLVLVVTSIVSDKYNLKLFFAEGHNDHLLPNMGKTARWIFLIYTVYILLGAGALWIIGMDPFEALCHSISCLATGGFSTRANGLQYWQMGQTDVIGNIITQPLSFGRQIAMEAVFEILMLLGATSFVIHFLIFTLFAKPHKKGVVGERFVALFKDFEIKFTAIVIILVTFITSAYTFVYAFETPQLMTEYLNVHGSLSIGESLRYNLFNVISCLTTTGYSNCGPLSPNTGSLAALGQVSVLSSVFLMIVGGAVGSTGGGIKQYRFGVAIKEFYWSVKSRFVTHGTVSASPITHHGETIQISDADKSDAYNYSFLYLGVLFVGSLALLALPYTTFGSSVYNFASALSGTGLGLFDFEVGTTTVYSFTGYKEALLATTGDATGYYLMLAIIDVGMILGRLEILACYFAFKSFFYDPIRNVIVTGKYKGLIYFLKEQKSIAIRTNKMDKAEAISAVIDEYENLYETNVRVNGNHATLNNADVRRILVSRRDYYLSLSSISNDAREKERYLGMAAELNWLLPRKLRKKI